MSCLDPTVMVFFAYSYVFQGNEVLKFQWSQVLSAFCFCVHTVLFLFIIVLCVALLLFVVVYMRRFQKPRKGKLNTWLNLTCVGVHRAHHFFEGNKGMP
jgi:hypothetical protein